MGCGCSSAKDVANPQTRGDADLARRLQQEENRRSGGASGTGARAERGAPARPQPTWNSAGTGHSLGGAADSGEGLSAEERRQRALEAAERRQVEVPGVSKQKAVELRERQQKEELLGKLAEHYRKKKMDPPMGLNMASLEQLRHYWEQVRTGDPAAAMLMAEA
mmetsp:Transcript_3846/g.7749  ORF Transcript_3846/g.7749 Transcript_3846/m.7749 type:complete len:164 (+) Transcript_3846:88-579(+)